MQGATTRGWPGGEAGRPAAGQTQGDVEHRGEGVEQAGQQQHGVKTLINPLGLLCLMKYMKIHVVFYIE